MKPFKSFDPTATEPLARRRRLAYRVTVELVDANAGRDAVYAEYEVHSKVGRAYAEYDDDFLSRVEEILDYARDEALERTL